MALNMSNKKWLCNQILPEAEFSITGNGITISSERLTTPRFIPFDINGKCRECKSTELELDFVVTKEGITLFCSRNKQSRFLPFDAVYELPGYCFFRVKNKARVFNVPHGSPPEPKVIHQNEIHVKQSESPMNPSPPSLPSMVPIPPKEPMAPIVPKEPMAPIVPKEPMAPIVPKEPMAPIVPKEPEPTPMELEPPSEIKDPESSKEPEPLSPAAQAKFEDEDIKQTWENAVNEFYASLAAATAGIPSQPKRKKIDVPIVPKESEVPKAPEVPILTTIEVEPPIVPKESEVPKVPEVPILTTMELEPPVETNKPEPPREQEPAHALENEVNEFYASLAAATAGIPSQPKRKKMKKENSQ